VKATGGFNLKRPINRSLKLFNAKDFFAKKSSALPKNLEKGLFL
jgi:hypothetical protein